MGDTGLRGAALAGGLWSIAAALLYVDLSVLPGALSPLASALSDGTETLRAVLTAGSRIVAPSLAVYLLLALLAKWLKAFDLRVAAPFTPVAAVLAAEATGVRPFLLAVLPGVAALAAATAWAHNRSEQARRWIYVVFPATFAGLCALGLLFRWSSHFPLRELLGRAPWISVAAFAAACLLLSIPAIRKLEGAPARIVLLLAGAWFVSLHTFDANYPIHAGPQVPGGGSGRPHVVLVVVDTLRADVLSYRSPDAPPTPSIDRLASESVVFSNALSCSSWTFPAVTSIMTGLPPLRSIPSNILQYDTIGRPTLAQVLQDHGYATRAIVGNPLLYRPFQLAQGFQRIETYAVEAFGDKDAWKIGGDRRQEQMHSTTTRLLTDQAIEWVRGLTDRPSFLWLHYLDPHAPYLPPREHVEPAESAEANSVETQRRLYRGEVRFIDSEIGRLVAAMKERGVYDDSIFILTSDHGEGFLEHGELGHGADLYQELLHVPLLLRTPGGSARRTVPDHVPSNALFPTLMDLLGMNRDAEPGWAPSLAPLITAEAASYGSPALSGANRKREPQWAVVMDGMKYIYREQTGNEEVYDLRADPAEQRRLADLPEPFVSRAREVLQQHLEFAQATLRAEGLSAASGLDEEVQERMKALGYIQ